MSLSIVLIDLTTDVTPTALRPSKEALQALAQAMAEQLQGPFAAEYGRQDIILSVGTEQDRQPGDIACHFRDTLDVQSDIAYHTVTNGLPDMEVGVDSCTSFGDEGESITSAADHEVLEMLRNPGVNRWVDSGQGYMRPEEVCDTVQNAGYKASNGLWLSNFLLRAAWIPGAAGPWDHLGLMKDQYDFSNGYEIRATPPTEESQVQGGTPRAPRLGESVGHLLGSVYIVGDVTEAQRKHKRSRYSRTHRLGVRL